MVKKDIPAILGRSITKFNDLWAKRKRANKPFVAVFKAKKYAHVKYDMFTCDYDLNSEAVKKLQGILDKFIENNKGALKKNYIWFGVGRSSGYLPDMELSKAEELAQKMADIIMDKTNYACVIPVEMCKNPEARPMCPEQTDCIYRAERAGG